VGGLTKGEVKDPLGEPISRYDAAANRIATLLTKIEVSRNDGTAVVSLFGDGKFSYRTQLIGERRLAVDLSNVASAIRGSVLPVGHSRLTRIRVGYHADKVRVVFDLPSPSSYTVKEENSRLVVTIAGQLGQEAEQVVQVTQPEGLPGDLPQLGESEFLSSNQVHGKLSVKRVQRTTQTVGEKIKPRLVQMAIEEEKEEREPDIVTGQKRFVGRRISLDFQQADITNILRLIAEVSGFNIVVGESVKAKVTMKMVSVPWDQALDMLLKMNNLGMIKQGNIVWVDSLGNISRQQNEEAQAKESKVKAEELATRVFYLRNVTAQELMATLKQYMTPRGVINVGVASNALVVRDAESKMSTIKQLVDSLDLEVPQVQIEARIVQADTNYSRSLGVQWGVQNLNSFPSGLVQNFKSGNSGSFGNQTSDFLVNLPAAVTGLTSAPAAGFTFGKTDGFLLDVRLSAGELLGLSKVIASPKITTLDKRDAKISQGESIPFQTISLQGTQTTFVDANLELNVTPQITSRDPKEVNKQIILKVRATRNAVGARSNPAGPSIDRREATTQVLVRDGDTMVIGGVFIDTQSNTVAGVPYLSRIPVLGWLFKNKTESVAKQELLIFLTPTIVKS
jgi:type IV pilus assembly protein PilQ